MDWLKWRDFASSLTYCRILIQLCVQLNAIHSLTHTHTQGTHSIRDGVLVNTLHMSFFPLTFALDLFFFLFCMCVSHFFPPFVACLFFLILLFRFRRRALDGANKIPKGVGAGLFLGDRRQQQRLHGSMLQNNGGLHWGFATSGLNLLASIRQETTLTLLLLATLQHRVKLDHFLRLVSR